MAQGGRIIQPATSVPGVTFGLLADPQGQVVGLASADSLRRPAAAPGAGGTLTGEAPMADPADLALLARAVAGDDAAFAALIEPHQRSVFRHCYRMLGSGADAEDATQDTLERAWRKLATYDGSGPFGAWLQRIATNVCLDGLRARRARIGPAG